MTETRGLSEKRCRLASGGGLYLIVSEPAVSHEELVAEAVRLEVPVVQLREKHMDDAQLAALAGRLSDITRDSGTLFLVNDRPDIALASGADGAHVGREDMCAGRARELLGGELVLGVSGNTPEEAARAVASGADYLGAGPVFPTATKPDATRPIGLEGLRRVAAASPTFPVVAVGGIGLEDVRPVMRAGASYAAVISAVCHADDPQAALEAMAAECREATS